MEQGAVAVAHRKNMPRNPGIDLLRGVSILLVVLHHLGLRLPLKHGVLASHVPGFLLSAINYNGYEAVFVFFVISGFLITGNTLQRYGSLKQLDASSFYARRLARIAPCLFALLLVLCALHGAGVDGYVIHRQDQTLPRALIAALGLHLNWYEGHYGYLPAGWDVLWSLSIEEAFYLGFPVACLLIRRTWIWVVALVVLAMSLPWSHAALAGNEVWQEKAYLPGMSAIAIGVLGAVIAYRWPLRDQRVARGLCLAGGAGLTAVLLFERWLWPIFHDACLLLLALSVMTLLLGMRGRQAAGSWRPWRATQWLLALGRLSYEIYLSHMFIVLAIVRIFHAMHADMRWAVIWYVPTVFLCWLLATWIERFISLPCGRWLTQRLPNHSKPATGATIVQEPGS